jgi:Na+/H+ antiporter NhaC
MKKIILQIIISLLVALVLGFIVSYFFEENFYMPLIFGVIVSVLFLNFSKYKKIENEK